MLEVLLLLALGRKIAAMARARGRSPAPWVILLIVFWVGGEVTGGILAAIVSMQENPNQGDPPLLLVMGVGLATAAVGAVLAFTIVSLLPSVEDEEFDEEFDEDDPPRRS